MTWCSQHIFKSHRIIMPNEGEGNDPGPRDEGARGWQNQGRHGHNQHCQGNRGADLQRG